jgi:hypothetical protein
MKQPHLEFLARRMREDHRHHPWSLSAGGLYIPHSYGDMTLDSLSYWDDVGFILNGRRFMVWWRHPRDLYRNAIEDLAWAQHEAEFGESPDPNWLFDGATTLHKQTGKSGKRKKPIGSRSRNPSAEQERYYALLSEREDALKNEGLDLDVQPSWKWRRYLRCMGMDLVAPVEVRNERELADMAALARDLVLHKTTLAERFPGVPYGRADWLRDVPRMRS